MANIRRSIIPLVISSVFAIGSACADEHDDHGHRSHEAHVHGSWEMFAALDDQLLSVTLKGPLVDALGFEAAPKTDKERNAVAALRVQLQSSEKVLVLDERAQCQLTEPATIILPESFSGDAGGAEAAHENEHSGYHDYHKDDHHEDGHHDGHDNHGSDDGHEDHDDHSIHTNNLEMTYVFDCAAPTRLSEITVSAFETFPAIEVMDSVFLSDVTTVAQELNRDSRTLTID